MKTYEKRKNYGKSRALQIPRIRKTTRLFEKTKKIQKINDLNSQTEVQQDQQQKAKKFIFARSMKLFERD